MLKDELTNLRNAALKAQYQADEAAAAKLIDALPEMLRTEAQRGEAQLVLTFGYPQAIRDRVETWILSHGLTVTFTTDYAWIRGW
jgi:hypothetical protein